jgi:hypothetical protein
VTCLRKIKPFHKKNKSGNESFLDLFFFVHYRAVTSIFSDMNRSHFEKSLITSIYKHIININAHYQAKLSKWTNMKIVHSFVCEGRRVAVEPRQSEEGGVADRFESG